MAIGARDMIDRLLVEKYATEKVDNHDYTPSMVDPEKMMSAMNDYSDMHRNMMILQNKLAQVCSSLNSKTAYYKPSRYAMA